MSFEEAFGYYREHRSTIDGVGYVFAAGDEITGVDVDDCRDNTGELLPWATEIINSLDSYSDVSPSETGVKVFLYGHLPGDRKRGGLIEMYDQKRFFAVTGHRLDGMPATLQPRQEQLEQLYARVFGESKPEDDGEHTAEEPPPETDADEDSVFKLGGKLSDEQVLRHARNAANGDKFMRLWSGDWSDYESRSEADFALLAILAFWTRGDRDQMDRLFRRSGLMRPKWDSPRGAETYGSWSIGNILASPRAFYGGSGGNGKPSAGGSSQPAGETGYDIILKFWKDTYAPAFRRGPKIYSAALGREITESEARTGAPIELVNKLEGCSDAPKYKGSVDREQIPKFFASWSRSAWVDMRDALEDEQDTEEVTASAEEEFRSKVAAALLHIEALRYGHNGGGDEDLDIQRRSLVEWCQMFAKPGNWQSIRSFRIWTRRDVSGNLCIALREELFSQISGSADLGRLSQNAFSRLCERYQVGIADESIRPAGKRAVALTPEFMDGLLAVPEPPEDTNSDAQNEQANAQDCAHD